MAVKTITVCDRCGKKPKAGLREVKGTLTEASNDAASNIFERSSLWCASCRDRAFRFMERAFEALK